MQFGRRNRQCGPWGNILRFTLAFVVLLTVAILAQPPAARAALAVRVTASANFGGNHIPGQWVPITITLANDGPSVQGNVVLEVDDPPVRYTQSVELPTRSQKVLTLYGHANSRVPLARVSFVAGEERVVIPALQLAPLRSSQALIGVVADDTTSVADLVRALVAAYGSTSVEVVPVAPAEIPANTFGLGSFSTLILAEASTGRWTQEQRVAVEQWVARGGQLVVAGGTNWRKNHEGLGELPPLQPTDSRAVAGLAGLQALVSGRPPAEQTVITTGKLAAGATMLAEQDAQPLIARRQWGSGAVLSLAFDPTTNSFTTWTTTQPFWQRLNLDSAISAPLTEPFDSANYSPGIQSTIRILHDIPGLELPPTWLLLLGLLAFILVIGPINYFVLRAIDRRELAWVSIPVITLLFAGMIFGIGVATKGNSLVLNSVSVVRVSAAGWSAEALTLHGVYTPSRGLRDLTTANEALLLPFSQGGLGVGNNLGSQVTFEQGSNSGVRNASFAQWTQRTVAEQAMVDPQPLALEVNVQWNGTKFVGQVTNRSNAAIDDALLVFGNTFQSIGNLGAGASVNIDWTPVRQTPYGYGYNGGLGSDYYRQTFSANQQNSKLGLVGQRVLLLNAISDNLLGYQVSTSSYKPVMPTPIVTPTPPPATPGKAVPPATKTPTSSAGITSSGQLRVVYWHPAVPLELKIAAPERYHTTVVIQETGLFVRPGGTP